MIIFSVPLIIVLFVVVGLGAGIFEALQINIMPYISIVFLIGAVVALVKAFMREEDEDRERKKYFIFTAISFILFLFTCTASVSTGDILSWIWYHI